MSGTNTAATPGISPVAAMSTSQLISKIGVASHLDDFGTGYSKNYGNLVADMQYLGISLIRSGADMDFDGGGGQVYADEVETAMAAGIRFDLVLNNDSQSVGSYTSVFDTLEGAHGGAIASIEGPNEVHTPDLATAAAYMASLSAAVSADPLISSIPILNYTILSYSPVSNTAEGDQDGAVTMGNSHTYSAGLPPNVEDSWYVPVDLNATPGERYAVTETGYETASVPLANGFSSGVSDDVQAKYDLDNVLDLIREGASAVYIDELYDLGTDPANNEDNFGVLNYDGTPKEAGVALHDLTTILADGGADAATFTPGTLAYSITGLNSNIDGPALNQDFNFGILNTVAETLPTYGYSLLLQKSNGAFDLAVWQEPEIWDNAADAQLPAPTTFSTITLAQAAAAIEVFDPLVGTVPIASYSDTDQVTIGVSDHPVIVEIDPFPNAPEPPAPPAAPPITQQVVTPAAVAATPLPSPAAVITGFGPGTIMLVMTEDAFAGDAQFSVAINGQQFGTFTTTAQHRLGQQQDFIFNGAFNAGANEVTVGFLNDAYGGSPSADRNLYVLGASQDGVASASSDLVFFGDSTQTMTVGTPVPGPTVLGSGPNTLALTLAEQAMYGDAQFTVSVDGIPVGGTQTATAIEAAGESQVFDVEGDFGRGRHTVTVTVLNGSYIAGYPLGTTALYVSGATIDGAAIANSAVSIVTSPSASFSFGASQPVLAVSSAAAIGSGPDTLALEMSERAAPAGAQFTVTVDGQQIGGVLTTAADSLAGQMQLFDLAGTFGAGVHVVTVDYLNANNSLLLVNSAAIDGTALPDGSEVLSNDGTADFSFTKPGAVNTAPTVSGSGPDSLDLFVSERGEPAGGQFTVSVDGQQIGGVQTTAADATSGQQQDFEVEGNFAAGPHSVSVDDLNANNSLLLVNTATINGTTVDGGSLTESNNGANGFSFITPGPPQPTTVGSGPDTLALNLSEDYFQGNAQFTIDVDNQQVGGVQTASAIGGNGQSQVFDVLGDFSGNHTVTVNLLSGQAGGNTLYVGGGSIDGAPIGDSVATLAGTGSASFAFQH